MNKKKAVYAQSLFCDTGSHDAVFHIQLVEENQINRYTVHTQWGKRGAVLQTKITPLMDFRTAKKTFEEKVQEKTSAGRRDRVYIQDKVATYMPSTMELMSQSNVVAIEQKNNSRHIPQTPSINLPNQKDEEVLECLENDMWIGIINDGCCVLEKRGHDVYLTGVKLEPSSGYYQDAHLLGGEFQITGYVENKVFYAVDIMDDDYIKYNFARRIQMLAGMLAEAGTESILSGRYLVGKERKTNAYELIGKTHEGVRFQRIDEEILKAEVRIYPKKNP